MCGCEGVGWCVGVVVSVSVWIRMMWYVQCFMTHFQKNLL